MMLDHSVIDAVRELMLVSVNMTGFVVVIVHAPIIYLKHSTQSMAKSLDQVNLHSLLFLGRGVIEAEISILMHEKNR